VLRQGDAFIVHSEQDRYRLLALLPRARVFKTFHPTYAELAIHGSASADELRRRLALPADCPILLFFGFVRPYKGLEYLIQALPLVLQQLRVHLLIVGEFWTPPAFYQRYAAEFGVEQQMTIVNRYVANEELQPYFDLADAVVLPYISATQSGVVQLAFGFGKPVITTRVGGLHEVVHDGVNGLIVPPQDEQALAAAIVRYLCQGLGPQMAANVRRSATAQTFSWQALVAIVEQAARAVLEELP
jgi:glycosyltransferase involved in cell wall biosynthesis